MENLKLVTIYTDGSANPNPGRGGYGVVLQYGAHRKELSGGYELTTNNRMELMAVIVGLEALKERCRVQLHSDSQYIVNALTSGAAHRWRASAWRRTPQGSKTVKNPDLWERLLAAYDKHDVEVSWVRGHAGVEDNECCDVLAMAASKSPDLPPDRGYLAAIDQQPVVESASSAARQSKARAKITEVGQPCRKCATPVVKDYPVAHTIKPKQRYYYEWYLVCPSCQTMYMVEEAKRLVSEGQVYRRDLLSD